MTPAPPLLIKPEQRSCSSEFDGRDGALRSPRPRAAGGTNGTTVLDPAKSVPHLHGAVTAQRAIPTSFGFRVKSRFRSLLPPALVVGLVALVLLARWAVLWSLPLPACGLRTLTGLPCPLCGSTRVLLASSHLDWIRAFHFNPLVFLGGIAIVGWFTLWIIDHLFRSSWQMTVQRWVNKLPLFRLLTLAVLVNWTYLCLALPR